MSTRLLSPNTPLRRHQILFDLCAFRDNSLLKEQTHDEDYLNFLSKSIPCENQIELR